MLSVRLVRLAREVVTRGLEGREERSFRVSVVLISLVVALKSTLASGSEFIRTRGLPGSCFHHQVLSVSPYGA